MNKIKTKKGQQEMVGFVLIVVLVMIALMIFLVISVRQRPEPVQSVSVENMLNTILGYTTECALVFEPQFDTVEDLVRSCFGNKKCSNQNKMACDYLNSTLNDLMTDLIKAESTISAYQFDVLERNEEVEEEVVKIMKGNCSGKISGASVPLSAGESDLVIRLRLCSED